MGNIVKTSSGTLIVIILIFTLGALHLHAQDAGGDCLAKNADILEQVENVCQNVGANEICYGNDRVNAVQRSDNPDFNFDAPGALADLSNIRSLFLSALNTEDDTWGIAQLRLLVNQESGTQDVTMLLFGDVEVTTPDKETVEGVDVLVASDRPVHPTAPFGTTEPIATLVTGTTVRAVGRTENGIFVRVELPETGQVGWVNRPALVIDDITLATLAVQTGEAAYLGTMQAFTFKSGTSPDCASSAADGLLIQTPEGMARVSFLINEVAIELTSTADGASAFVQANPETGSMDVNVMDGTAYVSAAGTTRQVTAGSQTSVQLSAEFVPIGLPTSPTQFDAAEISSIPLLPVIRNPDRPFQPETNPLPSREDTISSGNANTLVHPATTTNTTTTIGIGSGSANNASGSSSQPSQNSNDIQTTGGSGSSGNTTSAGNPNGIDVPDLPATTPNIPSFGGGDSQTTSPTPETEEEPVEISIVRIALAILVALIGIIFVGWMILHGRAAAK